MTYLPFGLYFLVVLGVVAGMLGLSHVLGQRHHERATGIPFESGIMPEGSARVRVAARFYLVAIFFVVFDLESVFVYAWAVAGRRLGWPAFWEMVIFIGVLVATLVYLWRVGALDWSPPGERRSRLR